MCSIKAKLVDSPHTAFSRHLAFPASVAITEVPRVEHLVH